MAKNTAQDKRGPFLYSLPPQNIEAEESLISAVLVDNNTLLDVVEILDADDFFKKVGDGGKDCLVRRFVKIIRIKNFNHIQ